MYLKLSIIVIVLITIIVDTAVSDYENTWNLYYEQPCCGNTAGHHIRHHRGKCFFFFMFMMELTTYIFLPLTFTVYNKFCNFKTILEINH